MKKGKKKGSGVVLWSILTVLFTVLFAGACIGSNLAFASAQAVNIALKTPTHKTVGKDDSAVYYESDFSSVEELEAHDKEIAEQLTGEGAVLLKNDNNTLPLAAGSKVSTLSHSSVDVVTCGTGSADIDTSKAPTWKQALEAVGFDVNPVLWDFYTNGAGKDYVRSPGKGTSLGDRSAWHINEVPVSLYGTNVKAADAAAGANITDVRSSFASYGDAAIVMLSRVAGEGADLEYGDFVDGTNVLSLTNEEKEMLKMAKEEFARTIVLINSTNALECDFLNDPEYGVDAALWIGYTGSYGLNAVADILAGNVNPSGHLVDTYCYDNTTAPGLVDYYANQYTNYDEKDTSKWYSVANGGLDGNGYYTTYQEGIYVGYKFYETAAAEGLIDYDKTVVYPFGRGLSYTTFTQTLNSVTEADGTITVDVTVTNTGSASGKEVVEVYYNPPYTNGGIEKASANLIGFAKTSELAPGASENVTVTFKAEDMASYDTYGKGCYVLEKGDYVISINADSHTVLDSKVYNVASDIVYDASNKRESDVEVADNKFGFAEGNVTYLSRANGFANYAEATAAPADFELPAEAKATFYNNSNWNPEDFNNADDVAPTTGAKNGLKLEDMVGVDYNDAQWDTFLDQLTVSDMDKLIALGGFQTVAVDSIGKVQAVDCDGPASINNNFTRQGSIGFPSAVMIAATWNTDLAHDFGTSIGKMADDMGVSGWYAPAMNIHRSAFAGRNFEYYSEDGVLSGAMASNAIMGAQEQGVYAFMKHFALNDQETNRYGMLCTWSTEQAIREIYLKPFEECVKAAGCHAAMSSYNYIGNTYAGSCDALLNKVLRGEWGFVGMVLTDYYGVCGYQDADRLIRNGGDLCLVNYDTETNHLTDTTSATALVSARQACKNILYTVANSRAYYPENLNPGMPGWEKVMIGVDVVLAAALIALEVLVVKKGYAKRKEEEVNA